MRGAAPVKGGKAASDPATATAVVAHYSNSRQRYLYVLI